MLTVAGKLFVFYGAWRMRGVYWPPFASPVSGHSCTMRTWWALCMCLLTSSVMGRPRGRVSPVVVDRVSCRVFVLNSKVDSGALKGWLWKKMTRPLSLMEISTWTSVVASIPSMRSRMELLGSWFWFCVISVMVMALLWCLWFFG